MHDAFNYLESDKLNCVYGVAKLTHSELIITVLTFQPYFFLSSKKTCAKAMSTRCWRSVCDIKGYQRFMMEAPYE